MFQPKAITRFALLAGVFYFALAAPPRIWPAWQRCHASAFRLVGDAFFSRFWFWPEAHVRFLDARSANLVADINRSMPGELPTGLIPPAATAEQDTLLLLLNRRSPGNIGMLLTSSSVIAHVPLALFMALVLATPMRWSRRGWVMLCGFLLVQLFVAVRMSVLLLHHGFAAEKKYALFDPGPIVRGALKRADEVLADNPTFAFIAPVCIWLLVMFVFARRDRKRAMATQGGRSRSLVA